MKTPFRLYHDGNVHIVDPRVTKPVSFAYIGDLHLHPEQRFWPPEYRQPIEWWDVEFARSRETLPRLLDEICQMQPDFVFFGGDNLDHYHPESADLLVTLCRERSLKPYLQIGNHDWEPEPIRYGGHARDFDLRAEIGKKLCEHWGMPQLYYSFEYGGIRFLALDTPYTNTTNGYAGFVDDNELDWITSQLEYEGPIVAFHHVPFAVPGLAYRMRAVWGNLCLYLAEDENGSRLRSAFEASPNLIATFSSHLHVSSEDPFGEHCQFVTAAGWQGIWRYVRIANTDAPKSIRQDGRPQIP